MSTGVDDDLWSAIGDPTRRRLLDLLLADGVATATTLSEQLPVSRQAVSKHLGVLDRVGLVHVTPAGHDALRGIFDRLDERSPLMTALSDADREALQTLLGRLLPAEIAADRPSKLAARPAVPSVRGPGSATEP